MFAGMISLPNLATAQEVSIPCTAVEIIQQDGTKRLHTLPPVNFMETIGEISTGRYSGTEMRIHLMGNGEILCQLVEETSDSE